MNYKLINIKIKDKIFFVYYIGEVFFRPKSFHSPGSSSHIFGIEYHGERKPFGFYPISLVGRKGESYSSSSKKISLYNGFIPKINYTFSMSEIECVECVYEIHEKQKLVNKMITELLGDAEQLKIKKN